MKKIAIFVEGWTEQVWVREYLLKWFNYTNIKLECFTLFNQKGMNTAPYSYDVPNPAVYFRIVNVGGDTRVNDMLVQETPILRNKGFYRIIGLRDMFSQQYRELVQQHHVDKTVIAKIMAAHKKALTHFLKGQMNDIQLCYAIMTIESWVLGLHEVLEFYNEMLTASFIQQKIQLDLETIDPENTFYNPATTLERIFHLIGENYGKTKGQVDTLISPLSKRDYENLLDSNKCQSFNVFHNALHNV